MLTPQDTLIIQYNQDILGGTPVFAGTRVPIQNLLDYLKAGDSLDEFLDDFPTVTREQVINFLERASFVFLQQVSHAVVA